MFLYELAVELGHRSTDVAAAAEDLGLGALSPATMLDAAQVDALRRHFRQLAPSQPAITPPPLPAAPAAPLTFGAPPVPPAPAPGPGVPAGAAAPPSWGPPPAPPAGAMVHQPPPPPPTAPPISGLGPPPGAGAPPGWMSPPPPPVGPAFLPPSDPSFAPPPPPPPSGAAAAASAPASPTGPGGLSRGQLAALGVVGVLVLGLFGFMVLNTGPDHARQQALAQQAKSATTVTFQASTTSEPPTTEPPTPTSAAGPDRYAVRDRTAFCDAARVVTAFELRLTAEAVDGGFEGFKQLGAQDQEKWRTAVVTLRGTGPIALESDLDQYLRLYTDMFEAAAESTTKEQFAQRIDAAALTDLAQGPGRRINQQVASTCA